AIHKVLSALRPQTERRGGQLWCVFGCGGNRDASKRPLMARAAATLADQLVITSDNPRYEDPLQIIEHVLGGLTAGTQHIVEPDRALAIDYAIAHANEKDVVVLAGKGHESTQEIAGEKTPFSDALIAKQCLNHRSNTKGESIAHWLGAEEQNCPDILCNRINTDTRQLKTQDLFVALKGENFDAHDFLEEVAQFEGVAAIVSQTATVPATLPVIRVADPLSALQKIAKKWRYHFRLPTIAVTGSNGKTTVKEMLAHIGRTWVGDEAVIATQGNLNNDIGVPLSVLRLNSQHRYAVFELGMNHSGEIAVIAPIVLPHIA
ncbi:unnamed protein product, partial [Darwinula stevensoni]